MTPLEAILIRQIEKLGPLSIAEYMAQCLYHPEHGYYTQSKPLGRAGDFITAPEISQMFGEMIGLCLAQNWLDQGAPDPFCLCELGPGTGQLMADVLRATRAVPEFHAAARVHLCEVNPHLRARQKERLEWAEPCWIADTTELPELPIYLIANEFFDCLPILQFVATDDGWAERVVSVEDGALSFAHRSAGSAADGLPVGQKAGTVLELCASANAIATDVGKMIAERGGCALVVDYGGDGGPGDSLQAVRSHQKTTPLDRPGETDLTAHVNFSALATAAAPAKAVGPVPQGVFLERLGITARAQALAGKLSGEELENHIAAHRRLTHPSEMGQLFKVLAIVPADTPVPAGFT